MITLHVTVAKFCLRRHSSFSPLYHLPFKCTHFHVVGQVVCLKHQADIFDFSSVNTEAPQSFETLGTIHPTTKRHIAEILSLSSSLLCETQISHFMYLNLHFIFPVHRIYQNCIYYYQYRWFFSKCVMVLQCISIRTQK